MTGVTRNDASFIVKNDEELSNIGFQMSWELFDQKIRAYAKTYNYTINEDAIIDAIHFMYTPWMQPRNSSLLIEEYVNVSGHVVQIVIVLLSRSRPRNKQHTCFSSSFVFYCLFHLCSISFQTDVYGLFVRWPDGSDGETFARDQFASVSICDELFAHFGLFSERST